MAALKKSGSDSEKNAEAERKELEELRDLVQGEISKMMDENPDASWQDIVKEADAEKKNAALRASERLCECCGERPAVENCDYCEHCLEGMKAYPFKARHFIIPVLTVLMLVFSCCLFAVSYSVFDQTAKAQALAADGKLVSSLRLYDKINTEIRVTDKNYGGRYLRNQAEIYRRTGVEAYENFEAFVRDYYHGGSLDKRSNRRVKEIKQDFDSYMRLYEVFEKAVNFSKDYEGFIKRFDEATANSGDSKAYIFYYKYLGAVVFNEPEKVQKANIDGIKKANEDAGTLYLPLYAEWAVNSGRYEEAVGYTEQLKKLNSESSFVYIYASLAHRLAGQLKQAEKVCDEGLEILPSNAALSYQKAVLSLLSGDKKDAEHYAQLSFEAADTQNLFRNSLSLYALCAKLNGKSDSYRELRKQAAGYGFGLSPDADKIISGEKSLKDVFLKDGGDFTWE